MQSIRALVVGVAAGLVVALVPSCGTASSKCDSTNCSIGCCDAMGQCKSGQTSDACGSLGNTCSVCGLGSSCSVGLCRPTTMGTGGGSATGGGSGTGGGSATGGGSGTGGGAATGGGGGTTVRVGTPCTTNEQCAGLGNGGFCKLTTNATAGFSPFSYPQGFCTQVCGSCPSGSVCAGGTNTFLNLFDETQSFCVESCTRGASGQCTTVVGTRCLPVTDLTQPTTQAGCWLGLDMSSNTPPFTGGGRPTKLGNACTSESQCSNPPDSVLSLCITDWPGGYCAASIFSTPDLTWCGPAGIGWNSPTADGGVAPVCLGRCTAPGTSTTSRSGYVCFKVSGQTTIGAMMPAQCTVNGNCTRAPYTECRDGFCCAPGGGCVNTIAGF
jgi:hypothetical protein